MAGDEKKLREEDTAIFNPIADESATTMALGTILPTSLINGTRASSKDKERKPVDK